MTGELIVLAAPASDDPYYAEVREEIVAFQIGFAQAVLENGDDVLVLADGGLAPRFVEALGPEHVLEAGQFDIWVRDFGTVFPADPIYFRYTAAGQGGGAGSQREADAVQDQLAQITDASGLSLRITNMLNDGGNLVHDETGNAVVGRKFLRDNQLDEAAGRARLQELLGARNVAFIEADEQGGLEHADGIVAFVSPGVLLVNSYPDDPDYARELMEDLQRGLPDVAIHEIVTPYDGTQIYDGWFGSACGLYTNMLVTPERIYLPQFGIPEDAEALATVRSLTDKTVVPVASQAVCPMGGGVRCMSWQLRGENAQRLAMYARSRARSIDPD